MANEAGSFAFWLRFGSVIPTGRDSFAKASPKGKTPGSERLQFFLNRSPMRVNVNAEVKNIWACPCEAQRSEAESRALALALAPIRCARLGGGFK
jgi:hypothetical protein